jgi:hypothetical protein
MVFLRYLPLFLIHISFVYANQPVARVTELQGKATVLAPKEHIAVELKKGDELKQESSILTQEKTLLKLEFMNKTTMTIGPKSKLVIENFEKGSPGVLRLLSGNIRSQVHAEKTKNRSKLFIKTQTAAMGIRGTDFNVIYNPKNHITTLVTVDGTVAFPKIDQKDMVAPGSRKVQPLDETLLNKVLKKKDSVEVSEGRFSGIIPQHSHPILPTKISVEQQKVLESTMEDQSKNEVVKVDQTKLPPPEGINTAEKFAPRAGGFVDFDTGLYVPPPANARFDKKENIYVASASLGHINQTTGDYIPPQGVELDPTKGFIAIDDSNEYTVAQAKIMNKTIEKEILPPASAIQGRDVYWDEVFTETPDWWFAQASQSIGYDSNVTRKLYYETVRVFQEPSVYEDTDFSLKIHQDFINGWTINPSLKGKARYFNRHEIPKIYSNNMIDGTFKTDFIKSHDTFGINSFFTFTLGYHHQQMVLKERPKIKKGTRRYHRDYDLGISETLQINSNLQAQLAYQSLIYKDFFENENGLIHVFSISPNYRLDNGNHLKFRFDYVVKDSTQRYYDGYFGLFHLQYDFKNLWEDGDLGFYLNQKFTNRTDQRISRGVEKEINPGFEVVQHFLEHGFAKFQYEYFNQSSKDKIQFDYAKNQLNLSIGLSF